MLGKLSWNAIPFDQPIPMAASLFVVLVVFGTFSVSSPSRAGGPICGASG